MRAKGPYRPEQLEDVKPLYPSIPRNTEPHRVHLRIAELVAALDELNTRVRIVRLKYGDSERVTRALDKAADSIDTAENFVVAARETVKRMRQTG